MTIHKRSKEFWLYQAPALGWAVLIFISSSISDLPTPKLGIQIQDKWAHFIVYLVLGYFLARALVFQKRFPKWRKYYFLFAIILGILYGISDEFHQWFVPGRETDVYDALADSLGVFVGVLVFRFRNTLRCLLPSAR